MRFCPFSQRVHLVLERKKIPHDVVMINVDDKPDWFLEKSPLGKIPCIEFPNGDVLPESLVICDYLDEANPQDNLYPDDPLLKAKDRVLIEGFNNIITVMFKLFLEDFVGQELFEEFWNELQILDRELGIRGTPFFGGNEPGMLDLMIWPWAERAAIIRILRGKQRVISRERFRRLHQWKSVMQEDPVVKMSYLEPEYHANYIRRWKSSRAHDLQNKVKK